MDKLANNSLDTQYNLLIRDVLTNGVWKQNRTGVQTKSVFGRMLRHDMSEGFPLLTTRRLPYKSTLVELEGFIQGITDKSWYQERGCHFWDYWCCPAITNEIADQTLRQEKMRGENELGPIYGYQWRKFGEEFPLGEEYGYNGLLKGYDQLWNIVENVRLKNDNRRLICSGWNPNQLFAQALPPCHTFFQVNITDEKLNLMCYQRSVDLAVNQSTTTYGVLLHLLAKEGGLTPGELSFCYGDTHIYENHIDQLVEQIDRPTFSLPSIVFEEYGDIFSWTHDKCKIENYEAGERIKYEVAI